MRTAANEILALEVIRATDKYVPRMCWSNAVEALLTSGHQALEGAVYVEGWAIAPDGIVYEHAWLKLADGSVLDPTWRVDARYFPGIEYTREYLAKLDPDFLPLVWENKKHGMHNEAYRRAHYEAAKSCQKGE